MECRTFVKNQRYYQKSADSTGLTQTLVYPPSLKPVLDVQAVWMFQFLNIIFCGLQQSLIFFISMCQTHCSMLLPCRYITSVTQIPDIVRWTRIVKINSRVIIKSFTYIVYLVNLKPWYPTVTQIARFGQNLDHNMIFCMRGDL